MARFYSNSYLFSEGNGPAVCVNIPLRSGSRSVVPKPAGSASPGDRLKLSSLGPHSRPSESKTWEVPGPQLDLNKASRWFWGMLKFKYHWTGAGPDCPQGGKEAMWLPSCLCKYSVIETPLLYESELQQRPYIYTEPRYLLPGLARWSSQFLVQ